MSIIGHILALLGLYILYAGSVFFGALAFFVGGFLAHKLFFCLRSAGVLLMVISIAYGYHNEYTPLVIFLIFTGFVLACFNTRGGSYSQDNGWGFDFDFSSSGSGSDTGGGGDCGGGGD